MWTVEEHEGGWRIMRDGTQIGIETSYPKAVAALATAALAEAPALVAPADQMTSDGLLPESWSDNGAGIAHSVALPGGRDFTNCAWSWRDTLTNFVPLMLQTSTEIAHFGSELAGFITSVSLDGGTVHAEGRFLAGDKFAGTSARDLLLDGRVFGVSVDPTENVTIEWVCNELDEEGFYCIDESAVFEAYEIGGLTMTPFQGFDSATISLKSDTTPAAAVAASGTVVDPPVAAFRMPEPKWGDSRLVEQDDGRGHTGFAVPLTFEGRAFYGHLGFWGQCHIGYGECVSTPDSPTDYTEFHLFPQLTAEGETVNVGKLVVGCDHADKSAFAAAATDHYAHSGLQWGNAVAVDGEFGPWVCGYLLPSVTDEQLAIISSSGWSGDWRDTGRGLDLRMGLTINYPGFPVHREALVASGIRYVAPARMSARIENGKVVALLGGNIVRPHCETCGGKARSGAQLSGESRILAELAGVRDLVATIEGRTRHLAPSQAAATARRIAVAASGAPTD